ncbi:MAG: phosphohydrolase [Bacteroidales bacterium]
MEIAKTYKGSLGRAVAIAVEAHAGQFDKAGADYIEHPIRVMSVGKSVDEKIVGVLHDVIEDSAWTIEMLRAEGFSETVLNALVCLTKLSEDEPYDQFISRVSLNPLAKTVKLNDLTDNMDIRRLVEINDNDVARLRKYLKAYRMLL